MGGLNQFKSACALILETISHGIKKKCTKERELFQQSAHYQYFQLSELQKPSNITSCFIELF